MQCLQHVILVLIQAMALPCLAFGAVDDHAIAAHMALETATTWYRSQVLGELDHAIGDTLSIAGVTIPTRGGAHGSLELDLKRTGKFASYHQDCAIALPIPGPDAKHPRSLTIYVKRHADGSWTYRNVTQLNLTIGSETLVFVDVNGDGIYNEPGVDGMTWAGQDWLFPLPEADERWCTQTLNLTGLSFGPLGEMCKLNGRPLATALAVTLPILQGINQERIVLGLTPRPEDEHLSSDLQLHCHYMSLNHELTHEEVPGKPGFTAAGSASGGRSILGDGTAPAGLALEMTGTYFHRLDVIRPDPLAFGLGYDGRYGGIDGRSHQGPAKASWWPVLSPAPDQNQIRTGYLKEAPDAAPGNAHAGYPIVAYFGTGNLTLTSYSLRQIPADSAKTTATAAIDCYTFDPKTSSMTAFEHCIALVPKQTLDGQSTYEVTMSAQVNGSTWSKTWRFSTGQGRRGQFGR